MPAPRLNVQNVATWLDNRGDPISSEEVEFVKDNDLISLAAAEKPPIRRLFEQQILARTRGLWGLFSSRRGQGQRADGLRTTVRGDAETVTFVAGIAAFSVVLLMLIAPLCALAYMDGLEHKLASITGCTLVLLAFLSWGTTARPFEMLAATAG
ncbi:hypothetical protein Cob_v008988 [Colletotrichum orbiculare MAFF 240422]|uniref:DUF6594 domain-containing protein n=1 Tax=Colletotrichum orbiculare (strain 104-T / ATCC 96160 / CBS 514.97 / LARS 414 / MAFF 240422) TaxID=1213857 RepID=A0A484FJU9_COLOR|nr:hypothetical protein Cob_v008988 [Colletotrichum orbiculare MAFF 240422]